MYNISGNSYPKISPISLDLERFSGRRGGEDFKLPELDDHRS